MWTHGWDLVLECRLSCGPDEELYMQTLEDLAVEAARINVLEEVRPPASGLCLPGQPAALHAWCGGNCIDGYLFVMASVRSQHWLCQYFMAYMLAFFVPDVPCSRQEPICACASLRSCNL